MIGRAIGVRQCGRFEVGPSSGFLAPQFPPMRQVDEMWHFVNGKNWFWKAYDPVSSRVVGWELGGRDDGTLRRLLNNIGTKELIFVTDDWETAVSHKNSI